MIQTATTLAILTTTGFFVVYLKLPKKVKIVIKKHILLTDAIALFGIHLLLGGTATALIAASMTGLMVTILLDISQENSHSKIKSALIKIPFLRSMI